jgi:hypothetical protein
MQRQRPIPDSLLHSKEREEYDITNRRRIREEHDPAVDADPFACRRRHPEFKGLKKVLIEAKVEVNLIASLL